MTRPRTANRVPWWRHRDSGQVGLFMVAVLGMFLVGFVGFGVDMTNLWFRRQAAQGAADAACIAGAMDMLVQAGGSASGGFGPGSPIPVRTAFDCATTATATTPCQYAALNGYSSPGLTAGGASNDVSVSFPTSVAGYTAPDAAYGVPTAFMRVDVADQVPVYFSALISARTTRVVRATAKCGLLTAAAPVPIVVLNPTCTHAFEDSGSGTVAIIGGPPRGVMVNSGNSTCAAATQSGGCTSNTTIDLSKGGPMYTGSDFGVFGTPTTAPPGFNGGTTGNWLSPATPVPDPFRTMAPPSTAGLAVDPAPTTVSYGTDGCPDQTSGCVEYSPGLYNSGISVKNQVAIFKPGVYYIKGTTKGNCGSPGTGCVAKPTGQCNYGLAIGPNGVVRPSTAAGDGSGGTMFYLSGAGTSNKPYGSALFDANAGKSPGSDVVDDFNSSSVFCSGGGPDPAAPPLPATLAGNILLAPCTGTYGANPYRGMLMYQDRANGDPNGQPSMQGGGGLLLGGNLYFHNCPENDALITGACAAPPTDYNAFLNLQGNSGSSTYIYGDIITDQLSLGGGGTIDMQLNPYASRNVLKVALLQ